MLSCLTIISGLMWCLCLCSVLIFLHWTPSPSHPAGGPRPAMTQCKVRRGHKDVKRGGAAAVAAVVVLLLVYCSTSQPVVWCGDVLCCAVLCGAGAEGNLAIHYCYHTHIKKIHAACLTTVLSSLSAF